MKKIVAMIITLVMALLAFMPMAAWAESLPETEEVSLIPVRQYFEQIGASVIWDSGSRSIHITIESDSIILYVGQRSAYVNGNAVVLETGVKIMQSTAFVSIDDLMLLAFALLPFDVQTFYLTEEARDLALDDFDYMVDLILGNSPWASVIYRRLGIVFADHIAENRSAIENMVPRNFPVIPEAFPIRDCDEPRSIAANYLISKLFFDFALPLEGIGHIGPRDLSLYRMQLSAFQRQYHDEYLDSENNLVLSLVLDVFTDPAAVWFYGEYEIDLNNIEAHPFPDVPGNIVTEIIIPDQVAYLSIKSFLANPEFDDVTIFPFLQEVKDFDHLILDLRGNMGGIASYFDEFILRRLISEPLEIGSHEFFSAGEVASEWMEAMLQTTLQAEPIVDWVELLYITVMPAEEFIAERGMVYFNQDDLASLDYAVVSRAILHPSEDSIGFTGKVWLLVDGESASASSLATLVALETGFATVVGENTSGVMGSSHTYSVLPNTGIIWRLDIGYVTDAYGRSLEEYGIAPQIRNRPGLDALETVLALIAEGNY